MIDKKRLEVGSIVYITKKPEIDTADIGWQEDMRDYFGKPMTVTRVSQTEHDDIVMLELREDVACWWWSNEWFDSTPPVTLDEDLFTL